MNVINLCKATGYLQANSTKLLRIVLIIEAKIATNNLIMQRIKPIFVAQYATNEEFYISTR